MPEEVIFRDVLAFEKFYIELKPKSSSVNYHSENFKPRLNMINIKFLWFKIKI
ncbi:hypothetical protein HNP38_003484 [Chryseobacterium defluvii]|uniref:Uncharacterized protein n=1 Tax=Chryseobacterium defluvii TaxID=160396 RepID=A0A840KKG0_9FLAO|nr:hypothetical protein [Chryseobacterium defluvii]